jgi:hypothetical protein
LPLSAFPEFQQAALLFLSPISPNWKVIYIRKKYEDLYSQSYPIRALDRPAKLQVVEAPRISKQSAHEGGKVVSPTHRPPLTPSKTPDTHFC